MIRGCRLKKILSANLPLQEMKKKMWQSHIEIAAYLCWIYLFQRNWNVQLTLKVYIYDLNLRFTFPTYTYNLHLLLTNYIANLHLWFKFTSYAYNLHLSFTIWLILSIYTYNKNLHLNFLTFFYFFMFFYVFKFLCLFTIFMFLRFLRFYVK